MSKIAAVRSQTKRRKYAVKEFFILLFLSIGLAGALLYFRSSLDTRERAASADTLIVRISKSHLDTTDWYYLYAFHKRPDGTVEPYTGKLDVNAKSCDPANVCTTNVGAWGSFQLVNGKVKVGPMNFGKGSIVASFRKRGSDWKWSNTVRVSVGTTTNLVDAKKWWVMPANTASEFVGTNAVTGETFKTVIGYDATKNICGLGTGRMMSFTKDKPSGYWGASVPWLFQSEADKKFRTESNLLWSVIDWQKKAGWHDSYLTSTGYEAYLYKPNNLLRSANFSTVNPKYGRRISSGTPEFPPYVLMPEWIGDGWGIMNDKQQSLPKIGTTMCSVTPLDCNTTACTGFWSAQADLVYLPNNQLPLLRMTYYEGLDNFYTNPTGAFGWREDYFFQQNVGLVRIDVKHFGPSQNGVTSPKLKLCSQDPDCLVNKVMVAPHITLKKS